VSEPCIQVLGVTLTLAITGTVEPGVPVAFEADLSLDNLGQPYTHIVYVEGGTAVYPQSSSDDPFTPRAI
jgi:hypothetical protein